MSGKKIVLSDLDSTLAHVHHRENLAPAHDRDRLESWINYSKGCIGDGLVEGVAAALRLYKKAGFQIGFVSGRNEEARAETVWWLNHHRIPWDEVKLHDANDPRHNAEHKVKYIEQLRARGFEVVLMFEDHVSVCEEIEAATGVPCVTIRPRYEDGVGVSFNLGQQKQLVTA